MLCAVPASGQPSLFASAYASAANILTLLIKVSAMVTVYRERWSSPLFPALDYLPVHYVRRNYYK